MSLQCQLYIRKIFVILQIFHNYMRSMKKIIYVIYIYTNINLGKFYYPQLKNIESHFHKIITITNILFDLNESY